MILYSVIIPVYNAEKTLRRCVDSLLGQDPKNAELILVNDGSRDGSLDICREYERGFACVCVVDKPNGGVSSARNAGLDAARGTRVLFVDSDDYVSASLFEDLGQLFAEGDWDLIRLSNCVDDGSALRERVSAKATFSTRAEALPKLIDDICSKALNSPWAKVYRRDILEAHQIRFPLGVSVAEDRAFNIHYSLFVRSYRVSEKVAYFVNTENEQSLSRKRHADLGAQFRIADAYTEAAIQAADIPDLEKELYHRAINFARCRSIYREAKDQLRDHRRWGSRQLFLWKRCGEINRHHMRYPATRYCWMITLPVKLRQTWFIDCVAKRLLR